MALECSPEFLALNALLLNIVIYIYIRNMENCRFDQSVLFLYTRGIFYVHRTDDLMKPAKVNIYIVYIFGKIELLIVYTFSFKKSKCIILMTSKRQRCTFTLDTGNMVEK